MRRSRSTSLGLLCLVAFGNDWIEPKARENLMRTMMRGHLPIHPKLPSLYLLGCFELFHAEGVERKFALKC